jgi:hypothetical protein
MTQPSQEQTPRPNVIWIQSDQHTPAVTGCYGDPVVQTPFLDRLAAEGTLITGAYCAWTAIATRAKARVKGRSVSMALTNSATNPHRSQISGILHAVVLRLWSVEALYAPNHGEMAHHTIANGSAVRSKALL